MNASHMVSYTPSSAVRTAAFQHTPLQRNRRLHPEHSSPVGQPFSRTAQALTIESIAYAGIDMPVHLVVNTTSDLNRTPRLVVMDYSQFSRLLRNQAPRAAAIAVMAALGAQETTDPSTGCRNWGHVQTRRILGAPLHLGTSASSTTSSIAA